MGDIFGFDALSTLILAAVALGVGCGSFALFRGLEVVARRRARLAGGPAVSAADDASGADLSRALSGVVSGVRRLGDQIALQDPTQLTALRAKLMQAGYYSREAAAVYLGVRAGAMILA